MLLLFTFTHATVCKLGTGSHWGKEGGHTHFDTLGQLLHIYWILQPDTGGYLAKLKTHRMEKGKTSVGRAIIE